MPNTPGPASRVWLASTGSSTLKLNESVLSTKTADSAISAEGVRHT